MRNECVCVFGIGSFPPLGVFSQSSLVVVTKSRILWEEKKSDAHETDFCI
jgi:hypothetical protein